MLVSVIIPTYKGSENLLRAVNSVLNQTITDLEVIVVDDNGKGTDEQLNTEKLLKHNIADSRLKYIALENNSGGSAARNKGAEFAAGKYLNFLDDDDAIERSKLEIQVNALEDSESDVGLAYSSSKIYFGGKLSNIIKSEKSGNILYDFLIGKIKMGTGTALIPKSVWKSVGGYDESFVRHQDWEFFAKILSSYQAVATPDAYFERYITNRNLPANAEKAEKYCDHYIEFLKSSKLNLTDKQLKNAVNYNNSRIALIYLQQKNIGKFMQILRKYDNVFNSYISFAKFILICIFDKLKGTKS